ncbi:MAG: serine/threonine-protein kinase [Kofleriaceae bacterium]
MSADERDRVRATKPDRASLDPDTPAPALRPSRYELGESIGRGGMGEVHDALDRQIGRRVAIKTIRSVDPSDRAVARFLREARIQGRLEHPAIPAVHELGKDTAGRPYFVMKKLAGTTLSRLLRTRDAGAIRQRALRAFVDVCLAVEFAHVNGIVHRDLKPDNIVLGEFGEVYVLDWGVAKVIGEADSFGDIAAGELETRSGAVLGTPGYMAPEQARGEPDIDARADVFSLGVVLREILATDGDVPPELRRLTEQATQVQRAERLPRARSLAEAVQRYLDGDRDLVLRRELARGHLALARTAFTSGTSQDQRSLAIRQAGRAIALDPQLDGAADLISRLMLEPPTDTPPAVERELHDDARRRMRSSARGALWGFVPFAGFMPSILNDSVQAVPLLIAAVATFGLTAYVARRASRASLWWLAVAFATIVLICSRLFSPILIAPGMAVLIAGALATNPLLGARQASVTLWGMMTAAVLLPQAAERLGLVSPTMDLLGGRGILIHTPLVAGTASSAGVRGALFVAVVIAVAVIVSHVVRRDDVQLRRRLHLQAWHLRQLFPDRGVQFP